MISITWSLGVGGQCLPDKDMVCCALQGNQQHTTIKTAEDLQPLSVESKTFNMHLHSKGLMSYLGSCIH